MNKEVEDVEKEEEGISEEGGRKEEVNKEVEEEEKEEEGISGGGGEGRGGAERGRRKGEKEVGLWWMREDGNDTEEEQEEEEDGEINV